MLPAYRPSGSGDFEHALMADNTWRPYGFIVIPGALLKRPRLRHSSVNHASEFILRPRLHFIDNRGAGYGQHIPSLGTVKEHRPGVLPTASLKFAPLECSE